MPTKPNVLFLLTDDQRFDTICALGNSAIHTPNMDALVNRGTTFSRAHIPGGTCPAVCMPSRAMLHTGRSLFHLQGEGQEIPPEHASLVETFRANGYTTFGTGKWHNGTPAFTRGFSNGDEIFFGGMGDHWNVPAFHFDPTGRYEARLPFVASPFRSNKVEQRQCDHIPAGVHSTDLFTDAAISFVNGHTASQPFFMYVSLMAPHDPRNMPQHFLDLYQTDQIELPSNFAPNHAIDTGALQIRDELLAPFPRDPDDIRRHIAEYYAMISHIDDALGRLLCALRDRQLLDNTLVVFAGDNGLALGQHGLMGKQNLYEHSVRVPLLFAGPGIPAGEKRDALVYLLDVFPTLCDLTGIQIPESVEGFSLKSCIQETGQTVRESLYLAYADSIRGLSDGAFKLIEYAAGNTQLFDLVRDPQEIRNLADTDDGRSRICSMRQDLIRWRNRWNDLEHPAGKAFWRARQDIA